MDDASLSLLSSIVRTQAVGSLGTLHEGAPAVSMVPVVAGKDCSAFYFLASALASHTRDILADSRTSLMLMDHLDASREPQSLARVSLSGQSHPLDRTATEYRDAESLYTSRFPEAEQLFQLGDFSLFRFNPVAGRFVAGFAKAFSITVNDLRRTTSR